MEYKKHLDKVPHYLLSMPVIYAMILPLAFLDIFFEIYQRICFPLYGLRVVPRSRHIRIDRHRLKYVTLLDRVNCAYCGYANGVIQHVAAILAETEQFWCAIRHKTSGDFIPPPHHKNFLPYEDEAALKEFLAHTQTTEGETP